MEQSFIIPLNYQGEESDLSGEFLSYGYTYRHLWRMLIWWNIDDEAYLNKVINVVLSGNEDAAIRLIKIFIPTIQSCSKGDHEVYKGPFLEKTYEIMTELFEPQPIYDVLKKSGHKSSDVNFNAIDDRSRMSEEQYASLFMQCYDKAHNIKTAAI
jgi:hypothetical protein